MRVKLADTSRLTAVALIVASTFLTSSPRAQDHLERPHRTAEPSNALLDEVRAARKLQAEDEETASLDRSAAEQGDADAQTRLGLRYSSGQGVPQDHAEAARWYRLAAEQGVTDAHVQLGHLYALGRGVPKDHTESVRWYRLAANQGHADAQQALGFAYAEGLIGEVEAANWLRLAATQGENLAQMVLGAMYVDGRGVLKDYVLAHMWLNIASANGLEEAREHRDRVEAKLTRTQVLRATELARACLQSDYQTCNP